MNLLVRVKLGYPSNFNFLGKPLLVEKYLEGKRKRKKEEKERKNNAKFSGHYVYPRTETVRANALRSHQFCMLISEATVKTSNNGQQEEKYQSERCNIYKNQLMIKINLITMISTIATLFMTIFNFVC